MCRGRVGRRSPRERSAPLRRSCPRRKADLRASDHRIRRAALWVVLALVGTAATAVPAKAEPSSIAAKRAEVARIERDLAVIDARVGHAAEAYNGARWRLGLVQGRIRENRETLALSTRNLRLARDVLADRVRHIYKQGEPSTAEVLLSSGSIVSAVDRIDLLERIGRQDATIVHRIRDFRTRARKARVRLLEDRERARGELAAAERA